MKELFYELHFLDRDDPHNPVIKISMPDKRDYQAIDFMRDLRIEFEVGYDDEEVDSRDDWAESVLNDVCEKYGCTWEYVVVMGTLVIE